MKLKIEHDDMGHDFWDDETEVIFISGHRDYKSENTSYCLNDFEDIEEIRETYPNCDIVPIDAYIHGGIALSINTFSCPWDSGVFGSLVFPKGTFGKHTIGLEGFVETWSQCLNGEIYGYIIENDQGEKLDSCWGFIGYDTAESEGSSMLMHFEQEQKKYHNELKEITQRIGHV